MMNFELTVHEGMELCPGTPTIELQFIRGAQVPEILKYLKLHLQRSLIFLCNYMKN